jgi:hypothetical protein
VSKHIDQRNFKLSPSQNALYFFRHCPNITAFTEYPGSAALLRANAAVIGGATQKDAVFHTC